MSIRNRIHGRTVICLITVPLALMWAFGGSPQVTEQQSIVEAVRHKTRQSEPAAPPKSGEVIPQLENTTSDDNVTGVQTHQVIEDDEPANDSRQRSVPVQETKSPFIRGLKQLLGSSPVLDDEGRQSFHETLNDADSTLMRIRAENREAIRQANRQVRIRGAGNSPNIILMVADTLDFEDLGYDGSKSPPETALRQLTRDGMRWSQFYSASPDPMVDRWCLLTGRHSGRAGSTKRTELAIPTDEHCLPEVFWQAGYETGLVGHWDFGTESDATSPVSRGFDEWFGVATDITARPAVDPDFPEFVSSNRSRVRISANRDGRKSVSLAVITAEESLAFVTRHARGRPFFLMVTFRHPTDFTGKGADSGAAHTRFVEQLNEDVGRIMDRLSELAIDNQTIVCLTSERTSSRHEAQRDDGQPITTVRSDLSEENLRVPLVIRWKGRVPANVQTQQAGAVYDLLPTFADIVSARRRPKRVDGISLWSAFDGTSIVSHPLFYWESHQDGFAQAVRLKDWKGIRLAGTNSILLFDLIGDPDETTDLAAAHPEVVKQLIRPTPASSVQK